MAHTGPGPATRVTTKGRQNGTAVAKMPHSARFLAASAMHTSPAASRASQHKKAVYSPRGHSGSRTITSLALAESFQ